MRGIRIEGDDFEKVWTTFIEAYLGNNLPTVKCGSRDTVSSIIIQCDSISLGNLELYEVAYSNAKMSHVWNAYIDNDKIQRLKENIEEKLKEKKPILSFNFCFNEDSHSDKDGCLIAFTICKIKDEIMVKFLMRASEAVKTLLGDYFLIHKLLRYLFPKEYLNNISVEMSIGYAYFSSNKLIVLYNNPRFKDMFQMDNPITKKIKRDVENLLKRNSKLISVKRNIDYLKTGKKPEAGVDAFKRRGLNE